MFPVGACGSKHHLGPFKVVSISFGTVDGRNPAPPKKPCDDDPPVNTNKQWFPILSKWCRISSIHSRAEAKSIGPLVASVGCAVRQARHLFRLKEHGRAHVQQDKVLTRIHLDGVCYVSL